VGRGEPAPKVGEGAGDAAGIISGMVDRPGTSDTRRVPATPAAEPARAARATRPAVTGSRAGARKSTDAGHADHGDHFRHSYSKDRAVLLRRLSRIEGQVRGIARMIEREDYCVDILQQTAALRAAVDALSILVLEDHVQGCIRTAAERGEADAYVDEVLDVVRRTLGRPIRGGPTRG
jgi:DNA-binding FrmR family transcriptional regulator